MQELRSLLLQELIEDIRAELLLRAAERRRALEVLVGGQAAGLVRVTDLALPSRLAEAVARLNGRHALALVPGGEGPPADAGPAAEASLVARVRELRQQEPPAAWSAVASELGLTAYALQKLRQEHGL